MPVPQPPLTPVRSITRRGAGRLVAVLGLALAVGVPSAVSAPSAVGAAAEVLPVPSDSVLRLSGHGWGHAIGMSQWGAFGAARKGLTWRQILSFYYPTAGRTTASNRTLRVWVGADTDDRVTVLPASGLRATTAGATVTLPTSAWGYTVTSWRIRRLSDGSFRLGFHGRNARGDTMWFAHPIGGHYDHPGTITLSRLASDLRLVLPDGTIMRVRGALRGAADGSSAGLRTVALVRLETYLRSVVPSEMPASWDGAALAAQSAAARTYALRYAADHGGRGGYDICSTTWCQVWNGTARYTSSGRLIRSYEYAASDAAIRATAGVALTDRAGRYANTMFSASNGGWSIAGGTSYLVSKRDPYDGVVPSTAHEWTDSVRASTLQRAFPRVGTLRRVVVTARDGKGDWGGRVLSVRLEGSAGSVAVGGSTFRRVAGLRTTWWVARSRA